MEEPPKWNAKQLASALGVALANAYAWQDRTLAKLSVAAEADPDGTMQVGLWLVRTAYAARHKPSGSAASVLAALERMGVHIEPGQLPVG